MSTPLTSCVSHSIIDDKLSQEFAISNREVICYIDYYNDMAHKEGKPYFSTLDEDAQRVAFQKVYQDSNAKQVVERTVDALGKTAKSRSYIYHKYANSIPLGHQKAVPEAVATLFSLEVTNYLNKPENRNKSRVEAINDLGIDNIFVAVKGHVRNRLEKVTKELIQLNAVTEDNQVEIPDGASAQTEARIKELAGINNTLYSVLYERDTWAAAIMLAKSKLIDIERVKLGFNSEYVEEIAKLSDLENESADTNSSEDSTSPIEDAENTTLEHWMLKADTVMAKSGIAAAVRTLIATSRSSEEKDELGFPKAADTSVVYLQLLGIRASSNAQNSDQFIDYLCDLAGNIDEYLDEKETADEENTNAYYDNLISSGCYTFIDSLLAKIESGDEEERKSFFRIKSLLYNNFNKANVNYTIVDYVTNKKKGSVSSRAILGIDESASVSDTINILAGAIQQNQTRLASENTIFNADGTLSDSAINKFANYLIKTLTALQIKDGPEKFNPADTDTISDILEKVNDTLMVDEFLDIDTDMMLDGSEAALTYLLEYLNSTLMFVRELGKLKRGANVKNSEQFAFLASVLEKYTTTVVVRTKGKVVGFEGGTRFGKSSYFNSTNKFFLNNQMEEIGFFITSNNKAGLTKYLEDNYLNNPIFAINEKKKISNKEADPGFIPLSNIFHGWLRELYAYATYDMRSLLLSPNVILEKDYNESFIKDMGRSKIVRGLGNRDGFKSFEEFSINENKQFNITHLAQSFHDSDGETVLVPTFVLGDANSVRYIPSTALDFSASKGYKHDYANVLITEIRDIINMRNLYEGFSQMDYSAIEKTFNNVIGFNYFPELHMRIVNAANAKVDAARNNGATNIDQVRLDAIKEEQDAIIREVLQASITDTDFDTLDYERIYDDFCKPSLDIQIQAFKEGLVKDKLATIVPAASANEQDAIVMDSAKFPEYFHTDIINANSIRNSNNEIVEYPDLGLDSLTMLYLTFKYGEIQHQQFSGISMSFYAGTEDAQKRWKEMIASGRTLDMAATDEEGRSVFTHFTEDNEPAQRVSYFDDFNFNAYVSDKNFQYLLEHTEGVTEASKNLYGKKGKGSSVTDGESYRSFDSYRAIQIALGDWYSNPGNEIVYNIIKNVRKYNREHPNAPRELTTAEWRAIIDTGVTFQPIKPFYYGFENIKLQNGQIARIPVQMKYAEFPLIPELLPKGSALRTIGEVMQEQQIDLFASTKCVKVGGYNSVSLDYDRMLESSDNPLSKDEITSSLSTNTDIPKVHCLPFKNYLVQTNVPYHMNTFRGEGTQVRKILGYTGTEATASEILKSLAEYDYITLDDGTVVNLKEEVTGETITKIFNNLENAGWVNNAAKERETMRDTNKLNSMLENSIANDAKAPFETFNELAFVTDERGNSVRRIPFTVGTYATDIMAQLLSRFRKHVVKKETHGGTAVQIAPLGMDLKMHYVFDSDGKPINIDYMECAITFDFKIKDASGKEVALDYLKYVDPSTGQLLGYEYKTNAQGHKVLDKSHLVPVGSDIERSKLCLDFPKINRYLLYRVPTERAYSTIAAKAVRFFPPTMGGVVALPPQCTTISGFDFDIDKLYYFLYNYFIKRHRTNGDDIEFDDDEKNKIWGRVYQTHPDIMEALFEGSIKIGNNTGAITLAELRKDPSLASSLNKSWKGILRSSKARQEASVLRGYNKNDVFEEAAEALAALGELDYVTEVNPYNPDVPVSEQPRAIRENQTMDLMWDRWTSPSTLLERVTPGGFYNIEDATPVMKAISRNQLYVKNGRLVEWEEGARPVEDLDELVALATKDYEDPYMDPSDFNVITHYQTYNNISGNLIGVTANQNIFQRLIATAVAFKMVKYDKQNKAIDNPILFGNIFKLRDPAGGNDPNAGVNLIGRYKGSTSNGNSVDSELMLAENLSAAVDAVKKATQEYFDVLPITFSMIALAVRIGAEPMDIGLLFNQPIVKEALRLLDTGTVRSFTSALELAYKDIFDEDYDGSKVPDDSANGLQMDRNNLFRAINEYKGGYKRRDGVIINMQSAYVKNSQMKVISILNELAKNSKEFGNILKAGKGTSANSVGSQISSLESLVSFTNKTALEFGNSNYNSNFAVETRLEKDGSKKKLFYRTGNQDEEVDLNMFDEGGHINKKALSFLNSMHMGIEQMIACLADDFLNNLKDEFFYRSKGCMAIKETLAVLGKNFNLKSNLGAFTASAADLVNNNIATYLFSRYAMLHQNEPGNEQLAHFAMGDNQRHDSLLTVVTTFKFFIADNYDEVLGSEDNLGVSKEEWEIGHDIIASNALLRLIKIRNSHLENSYLEFEGIGKMNGDDKNLYINAWKQLLAYGKSPVRSDISTDEQATETTRKEISLVLARMIAQYDFLTRGFGVFSKNAANTLTPAEAYEDIPGFIKFHRQLTKLDIDDKGNFIVGNDILGNIKEFILLSLVGSMSRFNANTDFWEYIKNVSKRETKALDESKEMRDANGGITFSKLMEMEGVNDNKLNIVITNPSNNAELSSFIQSSKGNKVQFYPIVRIGNRIYVASSLCDTNSKVNYSSSNAIIGTTVVNTTSEDDKSSVKMEYTLVIGDINNNSRSLPGTDFSPFNAIETASSSIDQDINKAIDNVLTSSPSPEEAESGNGVSTSKEELPGMAENLANINFDECTAQEQAMADAIVAAVPKMWSTRSVSRNTAIGIIKTMRKVENILGLEKDSLFNAQGTGLLEDDGVSSNVASYIRTAMRIVKLDQNAKSSMIASGNAYTPGLLEDPYIQNVIKMSKVYVDDNTHSTFEEGFLKDTFGSQISQYHQTLAMTGVDEIIRMQNLCC